MESTLSAISKKAKLVGKWMSHKEAITNSGARQLRGSAPAGKTTLSWPLGQMASHAFGLTIITIAPNRRHKRPLTSGADTMKKFKPELGSLS